MTLLVSSWGSFPTPVVFKDRTTGDRYMLTHDSATDTISIVAVPSRAALFPNREPLFQTAAGPIRLLVDDGELFTEAGLTPEEGSRATFGAREAVLLEEPVFTVNYSEPSTTYQVTGEGVDTVGDPFQVYRYTGMGSTTVKTDLGNVFDVATIVFRGGVFEAGVFAAGTFT